METMSLFANATFIKHPWAKSGHVHTEKGQLKYVTYYYNFYTLLRIFISSYSCFSFSFCTLSEIEILQHTTGFNGSTIIQIVVRLYSPLEMLIWTFKHYDWNMLRLTIYPLAWIPIRFVCIMTLARTHKTLSTMNVSVRLRDISPEISLELITHLLERQGNWLIMFPLSHSVTGIAFLHSSVSQLAKGITNTNLTPWHGILIVSVPGHEVRQDTATFTLRLWWILHWMLFEPMFSTYTENVRAKLQPAAI